MTTDDKCCYILILGDTTITIPQKNNTLFKYISQLQTDTEYTFILENNGFHDSLYIKILDNVPRSFNYNMLINALITGLQYFDELHISITIKNRITCWVKSLGKHSYTWTELLEKPNYGLEVFTTRFFPFHNVECKNWKNVSENTLAEDYPNQQDNNTSESSPQNEITKDYSLEYTISQKHNNFLGYAVLDPVQYPDMNKLISMLKSLNTLNVKSLMFEAILRLLITPSTCHIIKETGLWDILHVLFKTNQMYYNIFYYYMYYAMFILHHEDTVMFSRIKRNYRIIFTHAEALNFPHTHMLHIEQDPYIQQLTGETYLANSVIYYMRCKRYIRPVDVFERRFTLATGGALANIHLTKYNAAVSGSILVPCITYSELEDDFKNVRFNTTRNIIGNTKHVRFNDNLYKHFGDDKLSEEEKDFMSFLEYYYPSYYSLTQSNYIKQVLTHADPITVEEAKQLNHKPDTEQKTDTNEQPKKDYNILSDIDISITTDNYETFEEIALILGNQIKRNCMHIGDVWIKKVITVSSFKYKIYGPGLLRPIDLFRVSYGPDKMVKKFHCPIVRSWYDGANLTNINRPGVSSYLTEINKYWSKKLSDSINDSYHDDSGNNTTESVISNNSVGSTQYIGLNIINSGLCAMLSGVNANYKWFFNSKPCVEVLLKVAQRGYTTILNNKEMTALIAYMKTTPQWKPFVTDDMDIRGLVSKDHLFYNPCNVNAGIRYGLRQFKKPYTETYSKKLYVGMPKLKTEYCVDFTIKDNNKIYMPDTNKINLFNEYMEQTLQDDFSDGDEL